VSSPADQQIKEVVGSGPFKFAKDEWQPGEQVVYVRNSDYIAREEPPSGSTGGKKTYVEKVILAVHRRTLGRGEVLTLEGRPHKEITGIPRHGGKSRPCRDGLRAGSITTLYMVDGGLFDLVARDAENRPERHCC
jgi:hypothetical protein